MKKIIAVHSYKGGTGKTLMSTNLAAIFATEKRKVSLFDMDFRAPSLHAIFGVNEAKYWLNDYLNGVCDIKRVIMDYSDRINGPLYLGLANPSTEAIREMSAKDRKWEMKALGRLLSLRNTLLNDLEFDYLILDTSPGLQYSSINAIVSADTVIVVTTMDISDIEGTQRMVHELYDLFEKKTGIVVNKVPIEMISSIEEREKLRKKYEEMSNLPVIDVLPCFCDVLRLGGNSIFSLEKPEHPFTKILHEIAAKIEKL
ncbi:MinD/ParA family protein [Candidatus Bathyarchaeota archaeon]|nr:MinD/ParA family protein [Candidatus Bathyarchaeota archaeon]